MPRRKEGREIVHWQHTHTHTNIQTKSHTLSSEIVKWDSQGTVARDSLFNLPQLDVWLLLLPFFWEQFFPFTRQNQAERTAFKRSWLTLSCWARARLLAVDILFITFLFLKWLSFVLLYVCVYVCADRRHGLVFRCTDPIWFCDWSFNTRKS